MALDSATFLLFAAIAVALIGNLDAVRVEPHKVISNEREFKALVRGEQTVPPEIVTLVIDSSANRNQISVIEFYKNITVSKIVFDFRGDNRVIIDKQNRRVNAFMNKGDIDRLSLDLLPIDYDLYFVAVETVNNGDMDAIDKWTTAQFIGIEVNEEPVKPVLNRLKERKASKTQIFHLIKPYGPAHQLSNNTGGQ